MRRGRQGAGGASPAGAVAAAGLLAGLLAGCEARPVRVGSKNFTEGVLLGEIAARACGAGQGGQRVEHRRQLGGTALLWKALLAGEIDAYAEYTGTIGAELLGGVDARDGEALARGLGAHGVEMTAPLGFENTYALGVTDEVARRLGLRAIGDLRAHPDLALGLSHEFLERADGWPGLRDRYRLAPREVRGLDHDLAYRALASGAIGATDLYTTDAEIAHHGLRVLADDERYFPDYRAVILRRRDLAARAPGCAAALDRLAGTIDARAMADLNGQVKLLHRPEDAVAASWLAAHGGPATPVDHASRAARVGQRTREHLALVLASLLGAVAAGLPLGVAAARRPVLGGALLGAASVVQTIPSLVILVLLVPLLGIGARPAIVALFLYSLLPVVQGTVTGLTGIAGPLRESAEALGLPWRARLWRIELPLALPSILAGVRTAAVINVGTATLGALVGAGGYGQPILTGIRLDSTPTLLEGAVPAALLALALAGALGLLERLIAGKQSP